MDIHNYIRYLNNKIKGHNLHSFISTPYDDLMKHNRSVESLRKISASTTMLASSYMLDILNKNYKNTDGKIPNNAVAFSTINNILTSIKQFIADSLFYLEEDIDSMKIMANYWHEKPGYYDCKKIPNRDEMDQHISAVKAIEKKMIGYDDFIRKMKDLVNEHIQSSLDGDTKTYESTFLELTKLTNDPDNDYWSESFRLELSRSGVTINMAKRNLTRLFEKIYEQICETNPDWIFMSKAHKYAQLKNTNTVETMLLAKQLLEKTTVHLTLPDTYKISEMISFQDRSVLYKEGGKYKAIMNEEELALVVSQFEDCHIQYELRKKPKIAQLFVDKHNAEKLTVGHSFHKTKLVIDSYLEHEQLLKNIKFDFKDFEGKSFEVIDDFIKNAAIDHKVYQYATSIFSNKYKHLLTTDSLVYFRELYDNGYTKEMLQEFIGKKMAAIKTPEDFTEYLRKIHSVINGFNYEALSSKAKSNGAVEVFFDDNVLVIEIDTFEQSKNLGSTSWCITREASYFEDYKNEDTRQFFIYDFSKPDTDIQSMIGITLNKDGSNAYQHYKNDDSVAYYYENFKDESCRLGQIHRKILKNAFNADDIVTRYHIEELTTANQKVKLAI